MTEPPVVDGVQVGVAEFTGEAGDPISCILGPSTPRHPCRDQPRLMLMMALYRAGYQIAVTDGSLPDRDSSSAREVRAGKVWPESRAFWAQSVFWVRFQTAMVVLVTQKPKMRPETGGH